MRRRAFVALLGGAGAVAAQPSLRKRIGVLLPFSESDAEAQAQFAALRRRLQQLGWTDPGTLQLEMRWTGGDNARIRALAKQLVALGPDVLIGHGSSVTSALQEETRTIPIVFTNVAEPIRAGLVASMAHPGGNVTGFGSGQALGAKHVELLKEIAPKLARVGLVFNPKTAPYAGGVVDSAAEAAAALKLVVVPLPVEKPGDIEAAVAGLARQPNSALACMPDVTTTNQRALILALAARHRLPAVYGFRFFASEGGLASYGFDAVDVYRQAAGYVDRILRGERPAELPVQAPLKFLLAVNLKTAKALGLKVPATVLARADEVIE